MPESDARNVGTDNYDCGSNLAPKHPRKHETLPSREEECRKPVLGVWVLLKLQALVYDILPLEEGAGK